MCWDIEYTDEFEAWWNGLTLREQSDAAKVVDLLVARGTALGESPIVTGQEFKAPAHARVAHPKRRADAIYDQHIQQLRREGLLEPERGWER